MTSSDQQVRQARRQAWAVGAVLSAVAAWNVYKGRPQIGLGLGAAGGFLLFIGLAWVGAALKFQRGWMRFAALLGAINSRILLALIFYSIITPYGLLTRLFGRDVLRRRGPRRTTYWIARKETRRPAERFERLF